MSIPTWLQKLIGIDYDASKECDVAFLEYEKSREAKREGIRAVRTRTQELHAFDPEDDKETTGPVVIPMSGH